MAKKLKEYFDEACIDGLAIDISRQYRDFEKSSFKKHALDGLQKLELKDRVSQIGSSIYNHLDGTLSSKLLVLKNILGPENPGSYGTFNTYFWTWCLSSVVEQFGMEDREASMDFIYELTKRSTGEFALRPFLIHDPEYVFKKARIWSVDKNFHVRRLSSEGLRPLLPWARKCTYFVEKPTPVFNLLKSLASDEEKYVLTSVANHMGDMLKLNFESSILELESWANLDSDSTNWLIRHALRNQRKKGIQRAISLSEKLSNK